VSIEILSSINEALEGFGTYLSVKLMWLENSARIVVLYDKKCIRTLLEQNSRIDEIIKEEREHRLFLK
jgi:hypothetical protein